MSFAEINIENEVKADAVAAIRLMAEQSQVDKERIYLLGHSLGGTLAPVIAEQEPQVDGLIIMAGAARPLYELMLEQYDYLAKLGGRVSPQAQAQIDAIAAQVAMIRQGQLPENGVLLGVPAPYWQVFRTLDPVATALKLHRPMLVLQGERDYQVTITDFNLWQQGLQGAPNGTFQLYNGLNHLFITGQGPASPEEYMTPGHVAVEVINDIANWILAQ